jgi:inositol-pentakisphosphate 2-kinase
LDLLRCHTSQTSLSNVLAYFSSLEPLLIPETNQYNRLLNWLQTNTLLPRLRATQQANDTAGPLRVDGVEVEKFQLAMTLRDCTCFVRIPADPSAPVEAKLADLDKKNAAAKLGYWQEMETRLIEGGYYEGREVPRQGTDCVLERGLAAAEDLKPTPGGLY